jgi:UDP-N-acetylmuramoyl-L-alanyl-D-glutamate--2,6-diaminopimelate ligase
VTLRNLLRALGSSDRRGLGSSKDDRNAEHTTSTSRGATVGQAPLPDPEPTLPPAAAATEVTAVTYDSRQVIPGSIFVALRGARADGGAFVRDAVGRGAIAVVSEAAPPEGAGVAWVRVSDARLALAALAAALYGNPSEALTLVGITGTNGKTTTSYLLASIFDAAGVRCGRIGTVGHRIGNREVEAARTTPEAPDLQHMLREMVTEGCGACVMEVSSHALALRRAEHLHFAAAIFTNLTRDHLDFHGDMEEYFAAKRRLFERLPESGVGVTNLDDRRGADFAAAVRRPVTYAIDAPADVRPGPLMFSLDGLSFEARTPRGTLRLRSPLVGRPNAYNILAAVAAAMALDVPFDAIEEGIQQLKAVPGRFQVVSDPADDVRVVVDYAHTDDALKNLLETARALAPGRLITVFGCGGDRDRTKRPLMGAVAARLSDLVIVTSDNPRSEDPEQIVDEIKRGIVMPADRMPADRMPADRMPADRVGPKGPASPRSTPHLAVIDRKAAIERAVRDAGPGDLVLIAGKGHEKYQVIGDRVLPFDDVEVAREALARRRAGSRVS